MGDLAFPLPLSHRALFMRSDLTHMSQADCDERPLGRGHTERPISRCSNLVHFRCFLRRCWRCRSPRGNKLKQVLGHPQPSLILSKAPVCTACLLPSQGILFNSLNPNGPFLISLSPRLCQLSHRRSGQGPRLTT